MMPKQTLREAILQAQAEIDEATTRRNALLTKARENNVPLRTLAKLIGRAPSTIQQWAPLEDDGRGEEFLDTPV